MLHIKPSLKYIQAKSPMFIHTALCHQRKIFSAHEKGVNPAILSAILISFSFFFNFLQIPWFQCLPENPHLWHSIHYRLDWLIFLSFQKQDPVILTCLQDLMLLCEWLLTVWGIFWFLFLYITFYLIAVFGHLAAQSPLWLE